VKTKRLTVTGLSVLTLVMLGPAGIAAGSGTPAAVKHQRQAAPSSRAITSASTVARTRSQSLATYPSWPGRFYRVAATSANNVWAVGLAAAGGQISHWNGRSWADYLFSAGFQNVSAQSPTDVWAIGGTSWFYPSQTLADHWNGKIWRQVPTPTPGGSAYFNGVAATSPKNAWAVGYIGGGPGDAGHAIPIIEHWNGTAWRQPHFRLPTNGGQFFAVAATSARNAWAVGTSDGAFPNGALIEHWNGKVWRRPPANTLDGYGVLQGVTTLSPSNMRAVGYIQFQASGVYSSLILHWNGRRWSVVPSPNPTGDTNLWDGGRVGKLAL